jgi:hypothetical protein
MKLADYLIKHSLSDPEFGALIDRNRTTVMRLREETTRPDWDTLQRIVAATDGAVTPNDFLPETAAAPSVERGGGE